MNVDKRDNYVAVECNFEFDGYQGDGSVIDARITVVNEWSISNNGRGSIVKLKQ